MSLTQQDKQDITGIVDEVVNRVVNRVVNEVVTKVVTKVVTETIEPLKAEVEKQGVLLEALDERSNIALSMLSAQLASELTSKRNETRIDYLESSHKVLQATVKFHEQLLKTRPAS